MTRHLAEARFDHLQMNDSTVQFLFRQNHLDETEAALSISALERCNSTLDVAEVTLFTGKSAQ